MKTIFNILAFVTGIYGVIACSITFIIIRLLSIPLLPFNYIKLKENEKWNVVKKIFDICNEISDKL